MSNPYADFSTREEERKKRTVPDTTLIRRVYEYATSYKRNLYLGIAATIATSMTALASPYLHAVAIDQIILTRDIGGFVWWVPIFVAVTSANYLSQYVQTYQFRVVGENVVAKMRDRIMEKLQVVSLRYFSEGEIGRIISRPINDANTVRIFLRVGLMSILVDISGILGTFVVMFILNVQLTLLALAILPVAVFVVWFLGKYSRRAYRRALITLAGVTGKMQEDTAGIKVIQAYAQEDTAMKAFQKRQDQNVKANLRTVLIGSSYMPIVMTIRVVGTIIILFYGSLLVISNAMPIGILVAFTEYQFLYFMPLVDLVTIYDQYQSAMAAIERLFDLIDTKVEVAEPLPEARVILT